jgi:hypothetical protein
MLAPRISISFAERAVRAFVRQVRGSTAAPFQLGRSAEKAASLSQKYSSRISTKPDGGHASSACAAQERPFEN